MKIAVVFWNLEPERGGNHTFGDVIHEAVLALAPQTRHELVVYSVGGEPSGEDGVIRIPHTVPARARRRLIDLWHDIQDRLPVPRFGPRTWFERSLDREGVDLVWFATHYAEDTDRPYIFTILDLQHLLQPWFPEVSADGEWGRRQHYFGRHLLRATRVIVPNKAGEQQLLRHFPIGSERVLRLPHPTPPFASAAQPLPRSALDRFDIEDPYLFYPAQFWAHKNHATVLEALALLDGDAPNSLQLVLTGSDKGQLDHVRRLTRELGVVDRVRLLGFVDEAELVALYQHAHALVYLSFFGPENLPPLEAFALGCPVIYADVPGALEQLGDAALLVPPTDAGAVAAAVRDLRDHDLRERLTAAGRRRSEELSPARYVRGVLDFVDAFEPVRRTWS